MQSGSAAAGHAPIGKIDTWLALAKPDGDLVRVAIDMPEPSNDSAWTRYASVVHVDSGCTSTLVESAAVNHLSLAGCATSCDDKPFDILGSVTLFVQRLDRPVHLPRTTMDYCLVVHSRSSLNTDILIGTDTIGKAGGLTLRYDGLGGTFPSVVFGPQADIAAAATQQSKSDKPSKLSRHIDVAQSPFVVTLKTNDCQAECSEERGHWIAHWSWKDGVAPDQHIGSGIGEYPRTLLSADEEKQFASEMKPCMENGWRVKSDRKSFGDPVAVLPILAVN